MSFIEGKQTLSQRTVRLQEHRCTYTQNSSKVRQLGYIWHSDMAAHTSAHGFYTLYSLHPETGASLTHLVAGVAQNGS